MKEAEQYFRSNPEVVDWWKPEQSHGALVYKAGLRQAANALSRRIPGGMVLDVACGKGRVCAELLRLGFRVTAVDVSEYMLHAMPSDIRKRIHIKKGTVYELPFPDNSFDGLICLESLVHFDNIQLAFSEIFRVVRPGGFAVVNFDNRYGAIRILKDFFDLIRCKLDSAWRNRFRNRRARFRPLSLCETKTVLEDKGFRLNRLFYSGVAMPFYLYNRAILTDSLYKRCWRVLRHLDRFPIIRCLGTYVFLVAQKPTISPVL